MSLSQKEFDQMFDDEIGPIEEESLFEMTAQLFRGRALHITILVMGFTIAFMVLAIYAAVQFFDASETKDLLLWSVVFLYSGMCVAMLKMWTWMDMHKNSITREVKRLELQIARLRAKEQGAKH